VLLRTDALRSETGVAAYGNGSRAHH
jgi:hypothetical protein